MTLKLHQFFKYKNSSKNKYLQKALDGFKIEPLVTMLKNKGDSNFF